MLLSIFIFCTFLSLILPKSKVIFYSYLFLLWYVAAFCTQCADRSVYIARYINYLNFQSQTECGFNLLMWVFNKVGIQFDTFLMIIYAFILGIYAWFIKKNTERISFVLGLYGIFSYCIDVVQIRNSLGFAFVLIGLHQFLKNKMGKKECVKFCFFVIVGSLIHFSNIFFLLLLVCNKKSFKENLKIVLVTATLLIIIVKVNLLRGLGFKAVGNKIDDVFGRIASYSSHQINSMVITVIISFLLMIVILYISYKNTCFERIAGGQEKKEFLTKIMNSQAMLFITVFMIQVMPDVYRIQRYGMLLGYIGCSKYEVSNTKNKVLSTNFYNFLTVLVALLLFYLQITKLGNYEATFRALMTNNKFLR